MSEKSDKTKIKISAVIMASGHSRRFQGNKLWVDFMGTPVVQHAMNNVNNDCFSSVSVVTRDPKICSLAETYGYKGVLNPDTTNDTAVTIRLGIRSLPKDSDGCAFFVADQPFLKQSSIRGITDLFRENSGNICMMEFDGQRGNPVIFPRKLFEELVSLQPNEQGKAVIKRHPDLVLTYRPESITELFDIDYRKDLEELAKLVGRS